MNTKRLSQIRYVAAVLVMGLIVLQCPGHLVAADSKNLPARQVEMAVEYTGVVIPLGDDVSMDVIFYNKGRSNEDIRVWIEEKPENWKARIKTYRYDVTGVHVPSDDDKTLTFEAEPEDGVAPGTYDFKIAAKTLDGKFNMHQTVSVAVAEKAVDEKKSKGVKITTSYPVLQGPSDVTFEFSVEVDSKLDEDAVFNLFAQGPESWDINFKPAYESKYISSLRLKANQSSTIAVEVKPAATAQAGDYPIQLRVASGDAKAEAQLMVILTGTYDLEIGTATGLLSLDALQGKPAKLTFYVKNTGSAVNHDINFMSFKPENWEIAFDPESIPAVDPSDLKQVDVTITPNKEALVGDYSVSIRTEGEKATKDIEFRVTVKASSAWGWIGIGIIVLVIIGLIGLFRWLGRR